MGDKEDTKRLAHRMFRKEDLEPSKIPDDEIEELASAYAEAMKVFGKKEVLSRIMDASDLLEEDKEMLSNYAERKLLKRLDS
jgi:hypothetical protein